MYIPMRGTNLLSNTHILSSVYASVCVCMHMCTWRVEDNSIFCLKLLSLSLRPPLSLDF